MMKLETEEGIPVQTAGDLLEEYEISGNADSVGVCNLLRFDGAEGDVYNPSAMFAYGGSTYLAARYEGSDDEFSTRVGLLGMMT